MMPNPVATFPGSNTNRIITELFYNTKEDMIDITRAEGRPWVLFYSSGWGYAKLWPQMEDFRDWRVLWDKTVVEVYKHGDQASRIKLGIRGVAPLADKSIRFSDGPGLTFPRGQLVDIESHEMEIKPGWNVIPMTGTGRDTARIPLFVEEIKIHEAKNTVSMK